MQSTLIIKALDASQWPTHPHNGPTFTDDEQTMLTQLGIWENGRVSDRIYKVVGQALFNALDLDGQAALTAICNNGLAHRHRTNYVLRFPNELAHIAALPWELISDQGHHLLDLIGNKSAGRAFPLFVHS